VNPDSLPIAAVLVYRYWKDGLSWLHSAMGAILLVVAVFAFLLYRNSVRQSNVQLDRMKTPLGQSTLTDESLTISNELGSVTMLRAHHSPSATSDKSAPHQIFRLLFSPSPNAVDNPVHNSRLSRNDHLESAAYIHLTKN
jgi:hypothetical protein